MQVTNRTQSSRLELARQRVARLAGRARAVARFSRTVSARVGAVVARTRSLAEEVRVTVGPAAVLARLTKDLLATSRARLALQNAALRVELQSVARQYGPFHRSQPNRYERLLLAGLFRALPEWRELCVLVQPATVLRWHRQGWRLLWTYRSRRPRERRRRVAHDLARLVQDMGRRCRLWGAERIRGELLDLDVHLSKRTIQRLLAERGPRLRGPSWVAFWWGSLRPALARLAGAAGRLLELVLAIVWALRGRPGDGAGDLDDAVREEEAGEDDAPEDEAQDPEWATFARDHLDETWASDFFTVVTVDYQILPVFFVLELASRRVRH